MWRVFLILFFFFFVLFFVLFLFSRVFCRFFFFFFFCVSSSLDLYLSVGLSSPPSRSRRRRGSLVGSSWSFLLSLVVWMVDVLLLFVVVNMFGCLDVRRCVVLLFCFIFKGVAVLMLEERWGVLYHLSFWKNVSRRFSRRSMRTNDFKKKKDLWRISSLCLHLLHLLEGNDRRSSSWRLAS